MTKQAGEVDIFAEIERNKKERLILALRHSGRNVVGYIGEGINDPSALHAADGSISVDTAADVTKEATEDCYWFTNRHQPSLLILDSSFSIYGCKTWQRLIYTPIRMCTRV